MKKAKIVIFTTLVQILLGGCDQQNTPVIRNSPESEAMMPSKSSEDYVLLPSFTLEGIKNPAILVKIEIVKDEEWSWESQSVESPLGTTEHFKSGYPNTVPQSLIVLED